MAVYGTRSSYAWSSMPGSVDTLNLRHTFDSVGAYGIPSLAPSSTVPTSLAAWNVPRQRQHAAETAGAVHFFLDDYRFETVWSSPERSLARVTAVGVALTPDFSLWRGTPMAAQLWNTYRSRWCGAYWQAHGVDVVPTVSWSDERSFDYCFDGIAAGGVVAVSAVGVQRGDSRAYRVGLEQLLLRLRPSTLLVYGTLRWCDGLELPEVREYPTFWDRRRRGERSA